LSSGQAIINFESLKELFCVLKVKDTPKKHWSDFTSWGIKKSINELLLEFAQNVVVANFLSIIVDKVIAIDNIFWISLHLYFFKVGNKFHFSFVREKLVCKGLFIMFFI
jgi:hypothetical protein